MKNAPSAKRPSSPPARTSSGVFALKPAWTHSGFRLLEEHNAILKAAADRVNGGNVAGYLRRIAIEYAAADAGVPCPDLRIYDYTDVVSEAAKQAGVSVGAFQAAAAREQALRVLGIK